MKKFTLFAVTLTLGLSSYAQTIPNPGFETWVNNTETQHTYSTPQGWITSDIFITLLNEAFGNPGYVATTVTQTAGSHSGSSAVQMGVAVSNQGDTLNGVIFSDASANNFLSAQFGNGNNSGFVSSTRPASLNGFYKLSRIGGDTAAIGVIMTKWNTSTQSRDTVVNIQQFNILTNAASYTAFSVPITYLMGIYPDTVLLFAGISAAVVHPGTLFTIDDLAFSGSVPAGIQESHANLASVMILPNPFSTEAELKIADITLNNASFEVYDLAGKKVKEINGLSGSSVMINRENLSEGMYIYRLVNENVVVATGKFSVE